MKTWIATALIALAPSLPARQSTCPDQTVENCAGSTANGPNVEMCLQYTTILVITIPTGKTRCVTSYTVIPAHRHCKESPGSGMRCVPGETIHGLLFLCHCAPTVPDSPNESCQCTGPTNVGVIQDWALAPCITTPGE